MKQESPGFSRGECQGEVYDAEDVDDFLDSVADTIKVLGKEVLKARKEWQ